MSDRPVDMSPREVHRRLREASDLLELCRSLARAHQAAQKENKLIKPEERLVGPGIKAPSS